MRHGRSAGITKFSDGGVDGGKKNDQCLREEVYAVKRTGKPLSNREGFCLRSRVVDLGLACLHVAGTISGSAGSQFPNQRLEDPCP